MKTTINTCDEPFGWVITFTHNDRYIIRFILSKGSQFIAVNPFRLNEVNTFETFISAVRYLKQSTKQLYNKDTK